MSPPQIRSEWLIFSCSRSESRSFGCCEAPEATSPPRPAAFTFTFSVQSLTQAMPPPAWPAERWPSAVDSTGRFQSRYWFQSHYPTVTTNIWTIAIFSLTRKEGEQDFKVRSNFEDKVFHIWSHYSIGNFQIPSALLNQ